MKLIALTFVLVLLEAPVRAQAQGEAAPATPAAPAVPAQDASSFSPEQLEQIVAPIALYPDSLLTMILMAATYPLEIVEAARWVQKNPSLQGKALEDALKQHDWDPSVKSICGFSSVLKKMNENLDWTQDLGDAFLGQKKDVLDTVQKMRHKAMDAGTLKSTEQQKVSEEGQVIIIQSASPEVIYVPTYSPTVVYGSAWHYPTYYYPPMYVAPAPGASLFAFGMGVAWGAAVWGNCNWGGSDIDIDINKHNEFNRNTDRNPGDRQRNNKAGGGRESWQHDSAHRKGANYKNSQVAQKYGAKPGTNRVTKDQARGYAGNSARGSTGAGSTARPSTRPSTRPSGGTPSASTGGVRNTRPSTSPSSSPSASTRARNTTGSSGGSALSGSRSPSMDRSASTRGAASRGSGGSRGGGGGGRSGGGGGRRR